MSPQDEQGPVVVADENEVAETAVTAHRCSSDRVVFTEQDNTDGWIATDFTVDLTR